MRTMGYRHKYLQVVGAWPSFLVQNCPKAEVDQRSSHHPHRILATRGHVDNQFVRMACAERWTSGPHERSEGIAPARPHADPGPDVPLDELF